MCSLRHDRRRNGVIATDADPKHKTPAKNPSHLEVWGRDTIRQSNAHNDSDHTNDKLIAVHKPPAICVSEIAKRELPQNVTEIGGSIDKAAEEGRVVGGSIL